MVEVYARYFTLHTHDCPGLYLKADGTFAQCDDPRCLMNIESHKIHDCNYLCEIACFDAL